MNNNRIIISIADELSARNIKHDVCDYIGRSLKIKTSQAREVENPYLQLTDLSGDIGAVIMFFDEKLVYYYWEALSGSRGSNRDWRSTAEFLEEFDRFVLRWHLDTFIPNPYFI